MLLVNPLLLAGLTATAANAYKLTFFNSAKSICGGQRLGVWKGDAHAPCSTAYAGLASQVLIEVDNKSDSRNTVVFFKGDKCEDSKALRPGQGGCLELGGEWAPSYDSFKVVEGTIGDEPSKRAEERAEKEKRAREVKRTADANEASADEPPVHGNAFDHGNQTWRWHQLSSRAWTGVPHDEWDDNVHIANTEEANEDLHHFTDDQEDNSQSTSLRQRDGGLSDLMARDDGDELVCRVSAWCAANIYGSYAGLRRYGDRVVDHAAHYAAQDGKSLWEFLNKPFVSTLVGAALGTAGTAGVIFFSIWVNNKFSPGSPPKKPETCVKSDSQADLIKGAVSQLTRLADLEAAQMVIDLKNGEITSIAISTSRDGKKAKCGAPAYYDEKDKKKD